MIGFILRLEAGFRALCNEFGLALVLLSVRLIMAYEYIDSGLEKYHGDNWFADLMAQGKFPFPFSVIPADVSWFLATWLELGCGVLLIVGLGTRYAAITLMVLTWVAAYSVHFPEHWSTLGEFWQGYTVSDEGLGNFKLPLLFFIFFGVLVAAGPGKLSLDQLFVRYIRPRLEKRWA
jgi:putative oxidoreductase